MQLERREMAGIAGQDGPSSLHQIDHMDAAVAADGHFAFRADAEGIQKFSLVEPGAFHSAVFVPVDYRDFVDQIFFHPLRVAVPLNIGGTMLYMNGPGPAVQIQASPVPELESKNINLKPTNT